LASYPSEQLLIRVRFISRYCDEAGGATALPAWKMSRYEQNLERKLALSLQRIQSARAAGHGPAGTRKGCAR
jgi:hypothetical protein